MKNCITQPMSASHCSVNHNSFRSSLRILFTEFLETKTQLWKLMWAISAYCINSSGSPLYLPHVIEGRLSEFVWVLASGFRTVIFTGVSVIKMWLKLLVLFLILTFLFILPVGSNPAHACCKLNWIAIS